MDQFAAMYSFARRRNLRVLCGMARIHWDVAAMLGTGQRAHLMTPTDHEVPWTALLMLMLSTNVWYYATINTSISAVWPRAMNGTPKWACSLPSPCNY